MDGVLTLMPLSAVSMAAGSILGVSSPGGRTVRIIAPAAVMTLAMVDGVTLSLVPGILWSGLLVIAAMLSASGTTDATARVHRALSALAMAALVLAMDVTSVVEPGGHHGGTIALLSVVGAGTYVAATAVAVTHAASVRDRHRPVRLAECVLMTVSTATMGVAVGVHHFV